MRALGDTGGFAAQAAQVIQLGAPHLAATDELDRIDHRREQREHALDALAVGDLADREALVQAMAGAADADALVGLDAGAFAFDHLDVDDHGVARLEVRNGLAGGELLGLLLVERLNEVHGKFSVGCAPARLREKADCMGRASFYDKAAALSPHPGFTVIWGFWAGFGRPPRGPAGVPWSAARPRPAARPGPCHGRRRSGFPGWPGLRTARGRRSAGTPKAPRKTAARSRRPLCPSRRD